MRKIRSDSRNMSNFHETRIEQQYNAKRNPNSGAVNCIALKGDNRTQRFLIEGKCTKSKSFSVSLESIQQTNRQAQEIGKKFLYDVEFQGEDPSCSLDALTILKREDFLEILEGFERDQLRDKIITTQELILSIVNHLKKDFREEFELALHRTSSLGEERFKLMKLIK